MICMYQIQMELQKETELYRDLGGFEKGSGEER